MKTMVYRGGGLLAMALTMTLLTVVADADDEPKLSINAIMHKEYTVSRAPFKRLKKDLAAETPDWDKVKELTKTFVVLATALKEHEPTWGAEESWTRFTKRHYDDVKALDTAADAHNKTEVLAVHRRITDSCKACHDAHRYRGR